MQSAARRRRAAGRSASCWPRSTCWCSLRRRRAARPAARHRHRQPGAAGDLADGARRPALPDPDRHADLVPDGRGDCRPRCRRSGPSSTLMCLMLTQRAADQRCSAAQAAVGAELDARLRATSSRASTRRRAQHDRHRASPPRTAGIIVGGITLTGLGLRMTEFVEFVSQGNVMLMLLFTAFVCLVLGLGVPTTANYILVATLMAPVIVELGAQSGLIIPLIAVHLFVFYYGIMGDITPPVGLATFAAAAISGEDPIKTGIQGSDLRAAHRDPALHLDLQPAAAADRRRRLVRAGAAWSSPARWPRCCSRRVDDELVPRAPRWWEIVLLAIARVRCCSAPTSSWTASRRSTSRRAGRRDRSTWPSELRPRTTGWCMVIKGTTIEGDEKTKTVALQLGEPGRPTGASACADAGLTLVALGDQVQIGAGQVRQPRAEVRLRAGLGGAARAGADRPAQRALVLPAGAAAGGAGVVRTGATHGARGTVLTRKPA